MHRTLLALLALALPLAACSRPVEAHVDTSGSSSESDGYGVTGGGYHLEPGAPATFFGTWSGPAARRYTYLVVARDLVPGDGRLEQAADGTCSADGATLASDDVLTVNGVSLRAAFRAQVGADGLEGAATTLNGEPVAQGQWLFLFDGDDPSRGLVPVGADMPALPRALAELPAFTNGYVEELARSNDAVRSFLAGS